MSLSSIGTLRTSALPTALFIDNINAHFSRTEDRTDSHAGRVTKDAAALDALASATSGNAAHFIACMRDEAITTTKRTRMFLVQVAKLFESADNQTQILTAISAHLPAISTIGQIGTFLNRPKGLFDFDKKRSTKNALVMEAIREATTLQDLADRLDTLCTKETKKAPKDVVVTYLRRMVEAVDEALKADQNYVLSAIKSAAVAGHQYIAGITLVSARPGEFSNQRSTATTEE